MTTSRRKFIKISALGLGGVAASTSAINVLGANSYLDDLVKQKVSKEFKRTATYCEVCFWKCAAWTYTNEEGEIKKIIGNENDPHCYGRLCPRGTGGVGMYNDEDRLKTPLIRTTVNGEETFRKSKLGRSVRLNCL